MIYRLSEDGDTFRIATANTIRSDSDWRQRVLFTPVIIHNIGTIIHFFGYSTEGAPIDKGL